MARIDDLVEKLSSIFDRYNTNLEFYKFLRSLAQALDGVDIEADNNLLRFSVQIATGQYLDAHGKFYSVPRTAGESDVDYRKRIIASLAQYSGTRKSVEDAVLAFVNEEDLTIFEFGHDQWILGESQLGYDTIIKDVPLGPFEFEVYVYNSATRTQKQKDDIINAVNQAKMAGARAYIYFID